MQAIQCKCVAVGDVGAGKTSLLERYSSDIFWENGPPPTRCRTPIFPTTRRVQIGTERYKIALYDTEGQEHYDKWRPIQYRGTDVFLVCFSIVNPTSLANAEEKWVPDIQKLGPKNVPYLLIGTKMDLRNDREKIAMMAKRKEEPVTKEMGETVAKRVNAVTYLECSALTQDGVKEVFDEAIMTSSPQRFDEAALNQMTEPQTIKRYQPAIKDENKCCIL